MTDQPSPGEISRRLDDLRGDVHRVSDRLDRLPDRDDLTALATAWQGALAASEALADTRHTHLEQRVTDLEQFQSWAVRIVLGLVIVAVVGLVLAGVTSP